MVTWDKLKIIWFFFFNFNKTSAPFLHIIIAITTTHWRMPHFFLIHRMIHPWRLPTPIPDVGKILYRHIHSLHHKVRYYTAGNQFYTVLFSIQESCPITFSLTHKFKSYNPSAFSGTSMHPMEVFLYYSAAFIPVALGLHPFFALGVFVDCAIGKFNVMVLLE